MMFALRPGVVIVATASVLSFVVMAPDGAMASNDWHDGVNQLRVTDHGMLLDHPLHSVEFTDRGVRFQPKCGGPTWAWRLTFVGQIGGTQRVDLDQPVLPRRNGSSGVVYARDSFVEQYIPRQEVVEQRFVISSPLKHADADLLIQGTIDCRGVMKSANGRWHWLTSTGAVSLSDVYVFDAAGVELPATMSVTHDSTTIVVDGEALGRAEYPVTVDPEIGTNDFRISEMGIDGLTDGDGLIGQHPAVAYNSRENEFLIVWIGDDEPRDAALVQRVFGQRIDATTGAVVRDDFSISRLDGEADSLALRPLDVVYNPNLNEYFVVWNWALAPDFRFEIYGRRIDSAGDGIDIAEFRLSDMGRLDSDPADAYSPAVAYNPASNHYLVVWWGDDGTPPLVDDETEIFGQFVHSKTGLEVGDDFPISNMGGSGAVFHGASYPDVAYNPADDVYLVVWEGDDLDPAPGDQTEIFGQLIDGTTGLELNTFPISEMGASAFDAFHAEHPAVEYNSIHNEFLVVWSGDDAPSDSKFEILGQRLRGSNGDALGADDFPISQTGESTNVFADARLPAVSFNATQGEYLVVWHADPGTPLDDDEHEVFARELAADGTLLSAVDARISDAGPDATRAFDAVQAAIAFSAFDETYLVCWTADENIRSLVDEEFEIYGQQLAPSVCGNGILDPGEFCDDGQTDPCGPCNATCDSKGTGGDDLDNDSVFGECDNCPNHRNPGQQDTNFDGFGNRCDPDVNNDGIVGIPDLALILRCVGLQPPDSAFNPDCDFNSDGVVDEADHAVFVTFFGLPPG